MQQLKRVNLPSTSGTNPDHQRYHFIDLGAGADARYFEPTGLITVRSLASVGGTRGNKQFTRRKDRQARARGFQNFRAMIAHHLALHAQMIKAAGIR